MKEKCRIPWCKQKPDKISKAKFCKEHLLDYKRGTLTLCSIKGCRQFSKVNDMCPMHNLVSNNKDFINHHLSDLINKTNTIYSDDSKLPPYKIGEHERVNSKSNKSEFPGVSGSLIFNRCYFIRHVTSKFLTCQFLYSNLCYIKHSSILVL